MCQFKNAATIVFEGREGLRKIVICTGTGSGTGTERNGSTFFMRTAFFSRGIEKFFGGLA